jgi:U2 small nuclear ribonucleoprotein B''
MITPNPTLYIKNIDWKIRRPVLQRALYALATRHGKCLSVIVRRSDGLRGQAFLVFADTQAAAACLQHEQGKVLFGKDLVMEYAREVSAVIAKRDGTYVPKAKRKKSTGTATTTAEMDTTTGAASEAEANSNDQDANPRNMNDNTTTQEDDSTDDTSPSKYLLAYDLPADCNELTLSMLCRPHAGFVEARLPRPGLAFLEFADAASATAAKHALHGFKLTETETLKIKYGKE